MLKCVLSFDLIPWLEWWVFLALRIEFRKFWEICQKPPGG